MTGQLTLEGAGWRLNREGGVRTGEGRREAKTLLEWRGISVGVSLCLNKTWEGFMDQRISA